MAVSTGPGMSTTSATGSAGGQQGGSASSSSAGGHGGAGGGGGLIVGTGGAAGAAGAGGTIGAGGSGPTDGGGGAGGIDPTCVNIAASPMPGLGAWYKLDESMGLVCDYSGNKNHGTVEGAGFTRDVPGKVGGAMAFDGTDGRVHVPGAPSLDFVTAATLELWVRLDDLNGVDSTVSRGTGNSDNNVLMNGSCGNMQTIFTYAQQSTNVTSGCNVIAQGVWTHIGVVNDGATLTLYVNGASVTAASGGDLGALASDLYLGRREQGIFSLTGALDEVKWWTVARTEAEVCADAGGVWNGASCAL